MMESTHHQDKSLIENSTYIVITAIVIVDGEKVNAICSR